MNFHEILKAIKKIDKKILKIVCNGLKCAFVFSLIAVLILSIYITVGEPVTYYIGISLLKSGLFFIIEFIICGIVFNKIV